MWEGQRDRWLTLNQPKPNGKNMPLGAIYPKA